MIWFLRILFAVILISMLAITGWAGSQVSLWAIPPAVLKHPWFLATLADAYWGFVCFYLWIAWKEQAWLARLLWFVAVILLGNVAMSVYALIQLTNASAQTSIADLLARRNPGHLLAPTLLAAAGCAVYWMA